MLPRAADVARELLHRVEELEAENAGLRFRVETLEQQAASLRDGVRRARAHRRRGLTATLAFPQTPPA
jgi:cell division protein FtsB